MNGIGELKAWASARVMSTGVVTYSRGCSVAKNATGDFTITFDKQCDRYESICQLTPEQSDTKFAIAALDGQVNINTLTAAGVLADRTFEFFMFKLGNQDSPEAQPQSQND